MSGEIAGYKYVIPERPLCVRMPLRRTWSAWRPPLENMRDEDETAVYSHLFLGQEAALGKMRYPRESAYPWREA